MSDKLTPEQRAHDIAITITSFIADLDKKDIASSKELDPATDIYDIYKSVCKKIYKLVERDFKN